MNINLSNTYWERIVGYPTELRVDARWMLKNVEDDKPYGSLRIVSHPDLPPGQLRAILIFIKSSREKSDDEIMQTVEDYLIDIKELEVFSIDQAIETDKIVHEAPFKELEEIFKVKIFE